MLRADGAAQETVLVKDPDFREVAGIVADGHDFADISRQRRIDVAQPLKAYPVPPHGTRLRDRQQKKIEVVQTVGHARQPALAAPCRMWRFVGLTVRAPIVNADDEGDDRRIEFRKRQGGGARRFSLIRRPANWA